MKPIVKIAIGVLSILFAFLLVPVLIVAMAEPDVGMSLVFIMFFAVDPLVMAGLGVLSGTDIKGLWWIPLSAALLFPIFFGISVRDGAILELYIYSAIYLFISALAATITHFVKRAARGGAPRQ